MIVYDFEVFMYNWLVVFKDLTNQTRTIIVDNKEELTEFYLENQNKSNILIKLIVSKNMFEKSIKDMIFYLNFLVAPNKGKRWLFKTGLKLAGKYEEFGGLMINLEKNHDCDQTVERLLALFDDAKDLAVNLIQEYPLYLKGNREMHEIYKYSFDSELPKEGKE